VMKRMLFYCKNHRRGIQFFFPFSIATVPNVEIEIQRFKQSPPNIVYMLLSDVHMEEIKKRIIQYSKYDKKNIHFFNSRRPKESILHPSMQANKLEGNKESLVFIIRDQHTIVTSLVIFFHLMISKISR
jgi:hypothetical protein